MQYHLIGIEGAGMNALAKILVDRGILVSGCDVKPGENCCKLRSKGATIWEGHSASHIAKDTDLVIASPAIPENHVELECARRMGISVLRYPEMLRRLMEGKEGIAVAGTHGKSTTTGMMAVVLEMAGLDPSFVVGGKIAQLGESSKAGNGPHFVIEACEYARSFLQFQPKYAILTNIEADHLDYYRDLDDIASAFREFASRLPSTGCLVAESRVLPILAASLSCEVETYSIVEAADWQVEDVRKTLLGHTFKARCRGQEAGEYELRLPGLHNVSNALAVIALAHRLGVPQAHLQEALLRYEGIRRRFDVLCDIPIAIIDDYAHHPSEIRAVLEATRERYGKARIWCVFQPHQASRLRHLFGEFAKSFELADRVIVSEVFFARDLQEDMAAVSARDLATAIEKEGTKAQYISTFAEIAGFLQSNWQEGDVVLTLGAGSITELSHLLATSVKHCCISVAAV